MATIIVLLAFWQAVIAVPCRDLADTCGSAPYCNPPPEDPIDISNCWHQYCDNAQTCPWDGSKKRMMETIRVKYKYLDGSTIKYCVGTAYTNPYGNYCCLCSAPAVLETEP